MALGHGTVLTPVYLLQALRAEFHALQEVSLDPTQHNASLCVARVCTLGRGGGRCGLPKHS